MANNTNQNTSEIKVTLFKPTGKYYTEETVTIPDPAVMGRQWDIIRACVSAVGQDQNASGQVYSREHVFHEAAYRQQRVLAAPVVYCHGDIFNCAGRRGS